MSLPERKYYDLQTVAQLIGCDIKGLIHYASNGFLDICVKIDLKTHIEKGLVEVKSKISDEWIRESKKCETLVYKTNHATIIEKIEHISIRGGKTIKVRSVTEAKGCFSLNKKYFFDTEAAIVAGCKIRISNLLVSRIPTPKKVDFNKYIPYAINVIDEPIIISIEDMIVTKEELFILKSGGITTNFRLNKSRDIDLMLSQYLPSIEKSETKTIVSEERISGKMYEAFSIIFDTHPALGKEMKKHPYKATNILNSLAESEGRSVSFNSETVKNWLNKVK